MSSGAENPFEFVQQRFTSDCAVACLAMFLGVQYEEVAKHCSGNELVRHGLTNSREEFIAGLFEARLRFLDQSKIDWSEPAVLTVPSLNAPQGGTHAVYWNGLRVYDPNQGRAGKKTYSNQAAREAAIEAYQRMETPTHD